MKILTINNYALNNLNKYQSNFKYENKQVNFTGITEWFRKDNSFNPSCSISEDETTYVAELCGYLSKKKLSSMELKREYTKIYNSLRTENEQKLYKDYFTKFLIVDESQQPTQPRPQGTRHVNQPRTQHVITPNNKVVTQEVVTDPKQTQIVTPKEENVAKPEVKTITKEALLEEFEKLEKEDVPNFVAKIANSTRDTQYNLVEIKSELEKKHKELLENDPLTLFRNDLHKNKELKQEIEKELEEKFRQKGKKYSSTDIIKERIKTWEQMEKDAGFENYAPETLRLGRKLYVLEKQMKEQNISFVPKAPEQFASDDEKWKYIHKVLNRAQENEASTMEALAVFEKYGEKRFVSNKTNETSLEVLETNISNYIDEILSKGIFENIYHTKESIELTNALLQRFVQVHSKYATNQVDSRSYPDVGNIWHMFSRYKYVENKETMLMMINAMKDLAVDKNEYTRLKYFLKHFDPKLYEAINENDLQDIEKNIAELGKVVENLPDKNENAWN